MDGAHGPGVTQVVGGDRQLVAPELLRYPAPHLLEGGAPQVGAHRRQGVAIPAQSLQLEVLDPGGLERPHLVFTGLAGGQHPDHPIAARREGGAVAEEHLMISQAIGGHQAVGQAPSFVGDAIHQGEDLGIARELAEAGGMEPVARRPLRPVGGKIKALVPGQGGQGDGALLPAAAG